MPPKKKLKPLGGQTKLSFGKWPEASNHQEKEAATAIEKDDAKTMKNQHKQNLQNVRNKDFLSWHGNYMYCKVCSEASKSNKMSKEAQCRNFQNTMLNFHIDKEQIEISMYWVEWLITLLWLISFCHFICHSTAVQDGNCLFISISIVVDSLLMTYWPAMLCYQWGP